MVSETRNNKKTQDSTSKLIFGDSVLCAQFVRDYLNIPLLKNVQPEDIEDVSNRYIPLFTSEREADTVKKIKISDTESFYLISLIEHKTKVDYNVVMQLFRYMCFIWDDYEKEVIRESGPIHKRKDFKYPPILPIVYYEGTDKWTAVTNFKDRIFLNDIFEKYIPDFSYELISLHNYSNDELMEHKDEISIIMLLNKLQDVANIEDMPDIAKLGSEIWKDTPEYLLEIIGKIVAVLMSRLLLPTEKVNEVVEQVKERKMPELWENFRGPDFYHEKGRKQGEISIICKKLSKNQTIEQIADALEMKASEITAICEIAKNYAPDYDVERIYKELLENTP